MYIVDVNKPAGGIDTPPPPPPQPDYPSPPPNAIPFTNNGSQIPIYYNQTVVLQCLTSGVVSPVLIIRKVDHQTTVVGGGLQEGAKGIADHYCTPGEVCGDPVSQLHKIAFEVYDPAKSAPEPGTTGLSGAFLSCQGEKVNTFRPLEGRQWRNPPPSRESDSLDSRSDLPIAATPTPTSSSGTALARSRTAPARQRRRACQTTTAGASRTATLDQSPGATAASGNRSRGRTRGDQRSPPLLTRAAGLARRPARSSKSTSANQ